MTELPIAVRVYPDLKRAVHDHGNAPRADAMLVFDPETRIDETQALKFGSYRFFVNGQCLEEGLFYADDLTRPEKAVLQRYARSHRADTVRGAKPDLELLTLEQFVSKLYYLGYKGRCLLCSFNFPFDISRLAYGYGEARKGFAGGFSFKLLQYEDGRCKKQERRFRPRIAIKHIDSKRALKGFTDTFDPDDVDRIPEWSTTGEPADDYVFRGHMLDARTLAFALTDRSYTLESACKDFGVEHGKIKAPQHGVITEEYIDYNRRDVLATAELTEKLLAEYDRHPISLQATKAYSAASIGKAYLRAMGIAPIMQRQPDFPKRYLGYAQTAFYGGRASAHVRMPSPVVYTDFLSEYSTVNGLLGLWRFVIAEEIKVVEQRPAEVENLLAQVTPEWLFDQSNWKKLTGFARVIPNGDVLPLRAMYGSNDWQIGINHVYASSNDPNDGLWYALPDLAASVLLTGKQPRIIEAFRIKAGSALDSLKPIMFRGQLRIDPRKDDFFRTVIEERKRLARRSDLSEAERKLLDKALKTLGSATSYGIFAQMDRQERDEKIRLTCYGIDSDPYPCRVARPEASGEFCFPPLASLITSAGRLLLALLERMISDLGGTYAMEDTDSMAIVATARGGLIPCPGGPYRLRDGREAIRALSWVQVRHVAKQFAKLNPYDPEAIGEILKIENDNFDPKTGKQRQLWCYAISAKRYALFVRDKAGAPALLRSDNNNSDDRWSEHGLGHLRNPMDPNSEDREWIAQAWLRIVRKALGYRVSLLRFAQAPAVGRVTVSNPWIMRSLVSLNRGKPYTRQIKPFNFLLSAQVQEFGYPAGADPQHFHLIAPYESNPKKWLTQPWIDEYTGDRYRVITSANHGRNVARLKTYGGMLLAYEYHPELKCAGADGKPCAKQTVGLLRRRHVSVGDLRFIGKESNLLEEVEEGSIHDPQSVYTEYPDERRDKFATKILPKLKAMPMPELQRRTGLARSTLQAIRAGRRPHVRNQAMLTAIVKQRMPPVWHSPKLASMNGSNLRIGKKKCKRPLSVFEKTLGN